MKLYCDRNPKAINQSCKKHLIVAERGLAKIFYLRFYKTLEIPTFKPVNADDELINGLFNLHATNKLTEDDLKQIIQNIKLTYQALKNSNQEEKTLKTLSFYYSDKSDKRVNFDTGILLDDESIVFFYDFSDNMIGRLNTIFKGGIL